MSNGEPVLDGKMQRNFKIFGFNPAPNTVLYVLWGRFQYLMFHYKVDALELFLTTAKHTFTTGLKLLKIFY